MDEMQLTIDELCFVVYETRKKDFRGLEAYWATLKMVFNVNMVKSWMALLLNKWTNIVMDNERVHPLAKTLPSFVNNLL